MPRVPWLRALLPLALASAAAPLACGDLVIPTNDLPDGGDDGSSSGDDGGAATDAAPPNCDAGTHPVALACTGLYSDWSKKTTAPDVHPYAPGETMWADGADSSRWIWLPAAAKIDTTDPNHWVFPTGTKLWQELRLLGRRVETRFLWKMAPTLWFRTTYVWSDDESAAPELTMGEPNARGLPYEIPATSACEKCHGGANDFVLGFEVVGLAMPRSSGLNLQALGQAGLLTRQPAATPSIPGDPTTAGALAFLHANCGTSCHNRNPGAEGGATGLFLALTVGDDGALPGSVQQTDTWTTSYKVPSTLAPGGVEAGTFLRLAPGAPSRSAVLWTASRRDGVTQMPPIATHLVDQNDVALLGSWINELPP